MSYRSASARAAAFDQALAEAMSATVTDAIQPQHSSASDPAAGTAGPEGVAVEAVAADPAVSDPGSAPSDRDRVQHGMIVWHPGRYRKVFGHDPPTEAEETRLARLRRWQAVGERRT